MFFSGAIHQPASLHPANAASTAATKFFGEGMTGNGVRNSRLVLGIWTLCACLSCRVLSVFRGWLSFESFEEPYDGMRTVSEKVL